MANSIWKDGQHPMPSQKCKLKQQWNISTYLSKWPKSTILTESNADKGVEQWKLSFIASGIANSTATLEDTLAVSYIAKHTLTMQSSNCTPWYSAKGVGNLCS